MAGIWDYINSIFGNNSFGSGATEDTGPDPGSQPIQQLLNPTTGGTKFPARGINLVDVRTPVMQGLEGLFANLFTGMATNPGDTFAQMFAQPQVPGMAGFRQGNPAYEMMAQAPSDQGGLLGALFGQAPQAPQVPGWGVPGYGGSGGIGGAPGGGYPMNPALLAGFLGGGGGGDGGTPGTDDGGNRRRGNGDTGNGGGTGGTGLDPGTVQDLLDTIVDMGDAGVNPGNAGINPDNSINRDPNTPVTRDPNKVKSTAQPSASPTLDDVLATVLNPGAPNGYENIPKDPATGLYLYGPTAWTIPQIMEQLQQFAGGSVPDTWTGQDWFGNTGTLSFEQMVNGTGGPSDQIGYRADLSGGADAMGLLTKFLGLPQYFSQVQGLAQGGLLDPNGINIVGEQGPEAVLGNQQVVPLGGAQTQFTPMNQQSQGAQGIFQNLLNNNPEQQAFNTGANLLQNDFFNQNPGTGIMDALQPVFQRNLNYSLGELSNRAPSVSNSAMQLEGTNLAQQALQDFNLMSQQAMLQGQQNQLAGLGQLGTLAGQAGMNPMQRALGVGQLGLQNQGQQQQHQQAMTNLAQQQQQFASQFGLAQNQQMFNQQVMPALQLLMAMLGQAGPTGYQTVAMGG